MQKRRNKEDGKSVLHNVRDSTPGRAQKVNGDAREIAECTTAGKKGTAFIRANEPDFIARSTGVTQKWRWAQMRRCPDLNRYRPSGVVPPKEQKAGNKRDGEQDLISAADERVWERTLSSHDILTLFADAKMRISGDHQRQTHI